jgi:hypothetical protein
MSVETKADILKHSIGVNIQNLKNDLREFIDLDDSGYMEEFELQMTELYILLIKETRFLK